MRLGLPGSSDGERIFLQCRRPGFNPWVGKIPWRRKWQPTQVFLPGKLYGQTSLVGYSLSGHKELDMTEQLALSLSPSEIINSLGAIYFLFISNDIKYRVTCIKIGHSLEINRYELSLRFYHQKPGSVQFSSVAQSCPTLCNPMNHSKPGLPLYH